MTVLNQKKKAWAKKGITYIEAMIALGLVGIVAALVVPALIASSGNSKCLASAKSLSSQLMDARTRYRDTAPDPSVPPLAVELADLTKYTNVSTNCGGGIANRPFNFGGSVTDCYRYPDGSVLEAETVVGPDANIVRFNFYPRGTDRGDLGISLRMYYDQRRVTTYGAEQNNATLDPDWAKDWTLYE